MAGAAQYMRGAGVSVLAIWSGIGAAAIVRGPSASALPAQEDGSGQVFRARTDVLGLLRASVATLDHPYVEHWATALGVRHLLTRAVEQA